MGEGRGEAVVYIAVSSRAEDSRQLRWWGGKWNKMREWIRSRCIMNWFFDECRDSDVL